MGQAALVLHAVQRLLQNIFKIVASFYRGQTEALRNKVVWFGSSLIVRSSQELIYRSNMNTVVGWDALTPNSCSEDPTLTPTHRLTIVLLFLLLPKVMKVRAGTAASYIKPKLCHCSLVHPLPPPPQHILHHLYPVFKWDV